VRDVAGLQVVKICSSSWDWIDLEMDGFSGRCYRACGLLS
jgi:hypothetical protein